MSKCVFRKHVAKESNFLIKDLLDDFSIMFIYLLNIINGSLSYFTGAASLLPCWVALGGPLKPVRRTFERWPGSPRNYETSKV